MQLPSPSVLSRPLTPSAELVSAARRVASGELATLVAGGCILSRLSLSSPSGSAAGARTAPAAGFTPMRIRERRLERMRAAGTPPMAPRGSRRMVRSLDVGRENTSAANKAGLIAQAAAGAVLTAALICMAATPARMPEELRVRIEQPPADFPAPAPDDVDSPLIT